jgi:hypothetical protein
MEVNSVLTSVWTLLTALYAVEMTTVSRSWTGTAKAELTDRAARAKLKICILKGGVGELWDYN